MVLKIDDLTISPKPPSSNMKTDFTKLTRIIDELKSGNRLQHASLKVVIFDDRDLAYAKDVHAKYPELPFICR